MISICCVGFASLDVVCDELNDCAWNALLISSATVIVRAGGAIWLNPFATALFSVCSVVTVECCVAWACLVCLLLCKEEGSSPVSLQLLRGAIWACMRCPCLCLCWVLG